MVTEDVDVDIKKYILDSYNAAKLTTPTLEFICLDEHEPTKSGDSSSQLSHAQLNCVQNRFPFARSDIIAVQLLSAHVLVEQADNPRTKRVLELSLDITSLDEVDFQPGDTIGVLPHNSTAEVQALLCALQLEQVADVKHRLQVLSTREVKGKAPKLPLYIPEVSTPREVLRDCLQLRAAPKKQFLRALAECCRDASECAFLSCLSSKEAASFYNELIFERELSLLELLRLCPTCEPTLALLVEQLPRLLPRPYSIANSPLAQAQQVNIIFSIESSRKGLTTGLLEKYAEDLWQMLMPPPRLLIYFREPNKFRYTSDDISSNQLLLCVGTGLSPFLAFLEHKQQLLDTHTCNLGHTWLFVGATSATSVLHRARLLEWRTQSVLNRYYEALSREHNDTSCQYVQQLLQRHSKDVVDLLIQPNTCLYLCADGANISKTIATCLIDCLQQELHVDNAHATEMLINWRSTGKYREDLWL